MSKTLAALLAVCLVATTAAAEPITTKKRFASPAVCTSEGGGRLELPARTVLVPPELWQAADEDVRKKERTIAGLEVENESLKKSLRARPVRWYYIAGAFLLGAGAYRGYDKVKGWF